MPSVVVLFPDDFDAASVDSCLRSLEAKQPQTLPVVVTSTPKRFDAFTSGNRSLLVIPKPAWGWTILDAIRGCLERRRAP